MEGETLGFVRTVFELMEELRTLHDHDVIRSKVLGTLSSCGFEYFVVTRLPQPRLKLGPYMLLKSWPDDWLRRYDSRAYYRADPAVTRCLNSLKPFDWTDLGQDGKLSEPASLVMDEAGEHGLTYGHSVPIHDLDGFQAVVSMAGRRVEIDSFGRRALHLLALSAFETAERLAGREARRTRSALSPRERDSLQYAAAGFGQEDTAATLGISIHSVVTHLRNARAKLDATNTTHAVVKALRSRQIEL